MTATELLRSAATLAKAGRSDEALATVKAATRQPPLAPEDIQKAGRIVQQELRHGSDAIPSVDILVLGQCTTSWLVTAIVGTGWGQDLALRVTDGPYDSVLQHLSAAPPDPLPKIVVLVPWNQRLLGGSAADAEQRIAAEIAYWRQVWSIVRDRYHARVLQLSYDWVIAGPAGHHASDGNGPIAIVRRINERLRRELPAGSFLLDLEQVSSIAGREQFYDLRRYYWTKQPFSEAGACRLAVDVCAGIRALLTGPKKVLVLDLDNTLWGGVVGDAGPLGIEIGDTIEGEAYCAFQRYLKGLAERGVLLAIASKNNPEDAREPFEKNPDMVLGLDDLAAIEASWDPKSVSLQRLADTLNLGLDSFVFFDDNPAEREQIRQSLPMVTIVDVPADPVGYISALERGRWFETTALTTEDAARTKQYVVERQRREMQMSAPSLDDYLQSLEMVADLRPIHHADLARVVQLLGKTNQFNLTTRRHSLDDVVRMQQQDGSLGLTLRLRDRFGEHGLVAVVLGVPDRVDEAPALRIDTWLMSCRVIARGVEQLLFGCVLHHCRNLELPWIVGEYIPTKKNAVVARLYDDFGFERLSESADGAVRYRLSTDRAVAPKTFIQLEAAVVQGGLR